MEGGELWACTQGKIGVSNLLGYRETVGGEQPRRNKKGGFAGTDKARKSDRCQGRGGETETN